MESHPFGLLASAGSLVVNPRFASLPRAVQLVLLGLLLAAPLVLMMWLYRYELRLVRPAVARALFALRAAVVVLLWAVLALQPAWSRTVRESVPGQVLVAVDRSDSMRIADPQRPAAEKLGLARALGLHRGLADNAAVDRWLREPPTAEPERAA